MKLRTLDIGAEREEQIAYENPAIAEDEDERIRNAVDYHLERRWPQELAAQKAGISKGRLQR